MALMRIFVVTLHFVAPDGSRRSKTGLIFVDGAEGHVSMGAYAVFACEHFGAEYCAWQEVDFQAVWSNGEVIRMAP